MFTQDKIETLLIVNKFLALNRGYVEDAVFGAYKSLGLDKYLINPKTTREISESLNSNELFMSRFLNAASSLGLITKTGHDSWIKVQKDFIAIPWSELHNIFLNIESSWVSKLSARAVDLLIDLEILVEDNGKVALNDQVDSYFEPEAINFLGPLIQSYHKNSVPNITSGVLVEILKNNPNSRRVKPFSGGGWEPKALESFMLAMHFTTVTESSYLIDLLKVENKSYRVLDVGGGLGTSSRGFLTSSNPANSTVIYDRASSIPLFQKLHRASHPNLREKTEFVGGDFFISNSENGLSGLDQNELFEYITLGWILHDWDDEQCLGILRRLISHLKPDGKLCLFECVLPDSKVGQVSLLDITMLIQTDGKERTLIEYSELAGKIGLILEQVIDINARRQMLVFSRSSC